MLKKTLYKREFVKFFNIDKTRIRKVKYINDNCFEYNWKYTYIYSKLEWIELLKKFLKDYRINNWIKAFDILMDDYSLYIESFTEDWCVRYSYIHNFYMDDYVDYIWWELYTTKDYYFIDSKYLL